MRYSHHICLIIALLGIRIGLRAEPVPAKNVVFKPTFVTADNSFTAGTAFLCGYPEKGMLLLLTAQHLLGPAGGFPADLPWDSLNETIKVAKAVSMDDPTVSVTSKRAILIKGAHKLDKTGMANDIAVFELDSSNNLPALKLAETSPATGERIWLYGRQRNSQVVELFPATVVRSEPEELRFVFDMNDIRLPGTSGAPVLNSAGEVVAINIGGVERAGKLLGYGNPVLSVRNHLHEALNGTP